MKKTAIILAAVLAATSICLASCNKDQKPTDGNDSLVENNNDVSIEGNISFDEALANISKIEAESELDNEVLLTVEGVPVSAAVVRYANIACRQSYGVTNDADEATLEEINKEIDDFYRLNAAIVKLNREYNIPVTAEEYNQQVVAYIEEGKAMHGDKYEMIVTDYMFKTPHYVAEDALFTVGYVHLYDQLFGPNGVSEKKQEILAQLKEDEYICAKHILIAFPEDIEKDEEGNVLESAKAETLAKATEVLAKVDAGEDFDALIAQYGEDPGVQTQPDGYVFTKGQMVAPFEEAAYALEVGAHSGLVETTYGYHIILKLDLEGNALYNSDVYLNSAYTMLREMLLETSSNYEVEYADNYQTRVDEFVNGYAEQLAAQMQAQADYEAAQQAQAEAEAAGETEAAE